MKETRALLLALLALTAGARAAEPSGAAAPGASGPAPLVRCAGRLTTGVKGLAAIRAACPDIDRTVASLGLGAVLPAGWPARLDSRMLADLSTLMVRYSGQPLSARPDDALLRSLASHLEGKSGRPSWRQRLLAWLERVFERREGGELSWLHGLPRWVLDPRVWWWVRQVMMGLIVATLVVIAARESRAAGWLGGGKRRRTQTRTHRATRAHASGERVELPQRPEASYRPAFLLRILIDALRRSQRIDCDRSLTWREISARARFDSQAQRDGFARIALLAEHELYGPPGGVPEVPDELREGVEALREQLTTPPAAPAAVA